MILTHRGWLTHDEVRPGDETIGYNPVTGHSEWTVITRVVHYADAPLVRLGGSRWHATTTPNHRWIDKPVTHDYGMLPDTCPYCPWPEPPPLRARLVKCPECGWKPKAPGGVPLHRSLKHGIKEKKIERRVRRGKTTKNGLAVHLGVAHEVKLDWQPAESFRFTETQHLNQQSRILVSAAADTPTALNISIAEAALLGWLAGDGHIEPAASRKQPAMSIAQSKPRTLAKLRALLEANFTVVEAYGQRTGARAHATRPQREVSEYIDIQKTRTGKDACGPRHQFRFTPAYTADLLSRAGHPKDDAESMILRMSGPQRAAWLEAFVDAEGHRQGGYVSISQTYGPVLEAAHLAIYLCGYRPHQRDNKVAHPGWSASATISLGRPVVHGQFLRTTPAGRGEVWCVTTELGSWTARQDGQVFLTGNSGWNRFARNPSSGAYGRGSRPGALPERPRTRRARAPR